MSRPAAEIAPPQPVRRSRRPLVHLAVVLGTAGLIAGNSWLKSNGEAEGRGPAAAAEQSLVAVPTAAPAVPDNAADTEASAQAQAQSSSEQSDDAYRQAVLGTWYVDDYYGRCILDLKEGGKGTMTVVLSSYYAYLLAPRVDAVLEWTIEDGRALFETVSGKPEAAYSIIAREKGEDRDRKIVEISQKRMLLKDDHDDDSIATWTRAKSLAEASKIE